MPAVGRERNRGEGRAKEQEEAMTRHRSAWWFLLAFGGVLSLAAGPARSDEPRLAISGYDPVAYFTDGKPIPGKSEFEYRWHNLRWEFANRAHRELFAQDPEHYAPQFDGYCAVGVASSHPHKDTVDPTAWAIVDGRLYLTHDHHWLGVWRENTTADIKRGEENWPRVKGQTVVYDGYPHVLGAAQNVPSTSGKAAPAGGG
jgi:hypothetical protein